MPPLITVIEPEGPEEWFASLKPLCDLDFFCPRGPMAPEIILPILQRSRGVIITSSTAVDRQLMEQAPNLGIIAKCGGPPSNVDLLAAEEHGIAVSCSPGANTTSIAEYTVMLIIAAMRRLDLHMTAIRQGRWRTADTLLGRDLGDSTVGIVGLGAIGQAVLQRLIPFGCSILIYSPHADPRQPLPEKCRFCQSLEEIVPPCDAITVHCRATAATAGLFDDSLFSKMKPGSVFINTARGAIVDEEALARALERGPLGAAAVDVFQQEPPSPDNPLLRSEKALLTPHSSGWTYGALRRECDGAVASTAAFLQDRPIPGLLNPKYAGRSR